MLSYSQFVLERHRVWQRRLAGEPPPWTADPILATTKFTNVFRILDRGTQFLFSELINSSDSFHEALTRCYLYRYTGREEAWIAYKERFGHYPLSEDLGSGQFLLFLEEYLSAGNTAFTVAYRLGGDAAGDTRPRRVARLATAYFSDEKLSSRLFGAASNPEVQLAMLKQVPRVGDFMSMQILTDIGYSFWLRADENRYILPGPGAVIGAAAVDATADPTRLIWNLQRMWATDQTVMLHERPPSLMDVQNTLCEYGKYVIRKPRSSPYKIRGPLSTPYLPVHYREDSA